MPMHFQNYIKIMTLFMPVDTQPIVLVLKGVDLEVPPGKA